MADELSALDPGAADLELASLQLEEAGEELRSFFANTLDLLCIAGFDGYFKLLNPAWATTLGWSLEELRGRPFIEFVHPDECAATRAEMTALAGSGETVRFENRYLCKDGSYKWLNWNASSLGSRGQISAIARDVTVHRNLENQILDAGDREKERLGRELHDGLCQNLAGIAALSTALSRKLATADSGSLAADAAEITRLLNEAIGHARDMARGLNPVSLEQIGLAAALETLASNIDALFPVTCRFLCEHPSPLPVLGLRIDGHLYRIAQEAVSNAVAHARGKRVEIRLHFRGAEGRLSIRDNGVGISENALNGRERGIGFQTMDYRSRRINGTLQVRRRARGGTAITCIFPLPTRVSQDPNRLAP